MRARLASSAESLVEHGHAELAGVVDVASFERSEQGLAGLAAERRHNHHVRVRPQSGGRERHAQPVGPVEIARSPSPMSLARRRIAAATPAPSPVAICASGSARCSAPSVSESASGRSSSSAASVRSLVD